MLDIETWRAPETDYIPRSSGDAPSSRRSEKGEGEGEKNNKETTVQDLALVAYVSEA